MRFKTFYIFALSTPKMPEAIKHMQSGSSSEMDELPAAFYQLDSKTFRERLRIVLNTILKKVQYFVSITTSIGNHLDLQKRDHEVVVPSDYRPIVLLFTYGRVL